MRWTVKAVLARFNGDVVAAAVYCHDMMTQYPRLRAEYETVLLAIADANVTKALAAKVGA